MSIMRNLRIALSLFGFAALSALPALAGGGAWTDNFEAYAVGARIADPPGMGGWEWWAGSTDVSGIIVGSPALGARSLKIEGDPGGSTGLGDDTVQRFSVAGGRWTFRIMTFVPTTATGQAYIIMLNQYPAFNWSLQVEMDADVDLVTAQRTAAAGGFVSTPLVEGQWVEFRAEIDLVADSVDYFYNGVEFVSNSIWINAVSASGGTATIQALDLYGQEPGIGTTGTYFDDASLQPMATIVRPTTFSFFRGVLVSGVLTDLHNADDSRMVARPGVVLNQAERPIQLIIEGTSPITAPAGLKIVVEAHCNIPNISQRVEVFNNTTSAYTQIDQRNMPTADLRLELDVANPTQHVRASDGLIRSRISYKESGPVFSYPWLARIDEATWRVN